MRFRGDNGRSAGLFFVAQPMPLVRKVATTVAMAAVVARLREWDVVKVPFIRKVDWEDVNYLPPVGPDAAEAVEVEPVGVKSRPQLMSMMYSPSGFVRIARLSVGGVSVTVKSPVKAASS